MLAPTDRYVPETIVGMGFSPSVKYEKPTAGVEPLPYESFIAKKGNRRGDYQSSVRVS